MSKEDLKPDIDLSPYKVPFDNSISNEVTFKTKVSPKYYKQAYRTEWESMPDFQGWLKGVPGQPTRAYCTFCKKSLHAHRLSLLKHTCTLKHTKAAQLVYTMQEQLRREASSEAILPEDLRSGTFCSKHTVQLTGHGSEDHPSILKDSLESCDDEDEMPLEEQEGKPLGMKESESESEPAELINEEKYDAAKGTEETDQSGADESDSHSPPKKKYSRPETTPIPIAPSGPLTTHVLDTAKGNPIAGLRVSLYRLVEGRWTFISEGQTNPDGRYSSFIQKPDFVAGRYKLHFDVDRYFELRKVETLYPFIEIAFDVKSPNDNYHVPLLLSPFGYTTYRGS